MRTTSADFENFSDDDELWLSDLETRAIDLENELSVWRETRQRALGEQDLDPEPVASPPHESFRRVAGRSDRGAVKVTVVLIGVFATIGILGRVLQPPILYSFPRCQGRRPVPGT